MKTIKITNNTMELGDDLELTDTCFASLIEAVNMARNAMKTDYQILFYDTLPNGDTYKFTVGRNYAMIGSVYITNSSITGSV
jgi:hypothetical protein